MTAFAGFHGTEIDGTREEIVADYTDGSGRYVHYLMSHLENDNQAYLLSTQSAEDGDQWVLLLTRAEHLDNTLSPDWMLTETYGATQDLTEEQLAAGFDSIVQINGRAYLAQWADDVCAISFDYPHVMTIEAAREIVANDVRESYADLTDEDAVAHAVATMNVAEIYGADEVAHAYRLVLGGVS